MMRCLLKGVLSAAAIQMLDNYRHPSVQLLKIEATKCYLRGVRLARLSAIGLMRMGFVIGLVCVGVLLFHAGLFILLPWTVKAKAILGVVLGLGYVVIGGVALYAAMTEKTWMKKSGAADMLDEALSRSRRE